MPKPLYLPIAVRAYTTPIEASPRKPKKRKSGESWRETWPRTALVFDVETRIDASQRLMVGVYAVLHDGDVVQTGLILPDDPQELSGYERRVIESWLADRPHLVPLTREAFLQDVFYPIADHGQAVVTGFNLPFDLSRAAIRATPTRSGEGFVFTYLNHVDTRGRKTSPQWAPRVRITPIDGHRAIIQFSGRKQSTPFLDTATLAYALTGMRQSLKSACKIFGVEKPKGDPGTLGRITRELLDYAFTDVEITAALYQRVLDEYARHPIALAPHQVYSPASIGKAYLREMRLTLPELVSEVDLDVDTILGVATETYYGGRTECRIRRVPVPVVYTDFRSMYPTVNTLMGLWRYLTAERIHAVDATEETQAFLDAVTLEDLFRPETWQRLAVIAELEPDDDVLPRRVRFGDDAYSNHSIAVGSLTSYHPLWYTLADLVVSKLKTGKAPRIRRALRLVPEGRQQLRPISLGGQVEIDPNEVDLFAAGVVERGKVKRGEGMYAELSDTERDALEYFLKIFLNATSYGIFMEMNRKDKQRTRVRVHGLEPFETEVDHPEELGDFCFPPLATLITSGARLMLTLAERTVHERGGSYAFMDTDSIAIVSTEHGGLIACPGGSERSPDGREAIRALSWREVEAIRERFRSLNPYGDGKDILELEAQNFARCPYPDDHSKGCTCQGRKQLHAYSVASKRYTLFNRDGDIIDIRKPSQHVLGGYNAPIDPATGRKVETWIELVWEWLVRRALGLPNEPLPWTRSTATSQLTISTPQMHVWFDRWNRTEAGKLRPYDQTVKPYNFLTHPLVDPLSYAALREIDGEVSLVAPYGERSEFVNRRDPGGRLYRADVDFTPRTYRDVIDAYDRHPERKFAGPDGEPCGRATRGLLQDLLVVATRIRRIGKEANEIDRIEVAVIEREDERLTIYDEGMFDALMRVIQEIQTVVLCRLTGCSRSMVKYLKSGDRRPSRKVYSKLLRVVGRFARERLRGVMVDVPGDEDAIALLAGRLKRSPDDH